MTKRISLLIFAFWILFNSLAQEQLLINSYNRQQTSLNGNWHYIVDPYENGYYNYRYEPFDQQESPWASAFFLNSKPKNESDLIEYNFDTSPTLKVPGDWNSQTPELTYYEGTIWYKTSFDYSKKENSNLVHLYFEAANYKAEVYLNGKKLGTHIGGFTPFNFNVTSLLKAKSNLLVVKVDNKRLKEAVPTLNTDWWNYGGLTRDVKLIETPETFIADYQIQLDPSKNKSVKGFIALRGKQYGKQKIKLRIPELGINTQLKTEQNGKTTLQIPANTIKHWSPKNPKLYDVHITTNLDTIVDQIGFRTITTKGSSILLNDKPIYLKGISIHEENPLRGGRAHSLQDAQQLLNWAQELGCNYVRLAHYPHNEHMVRLADKMGMLVWEENPVYWTIDWENEETYNNAQNQLSELIARDKNRASVIIWSMANETPNVPERNRFLTKLATYTRSQDDTRLISAALEQKDYQDNPKIRTIDDPFANEVDILSFNQYIGWYDGLPEKCKTISWHIEQDKPVLISEFGAGAKAGLYGNKTQRWTEDYQEELYIQTLQMIDRIEQLQGFSPWILADFRSPRRVLPNIQDGWNRKGLISDDGIKKKAFYILQEFYQTKKKK